MLGLLIVVLWLLAAAGLAWLVWSHRNSLGLAKANIPGDPACHRGPFYNNPSDPRLVVPKRYGLGWTVNLAHPHARTVVVFTLALPIALVLLKAFRG